MRLHLLANSHLDPVWLWDWQEGLNEGIATCRTVLQLMEEFPELTYIRGESSVYAHIARHDPATMEKIAAHIVQGRWDVVGGTWCQPDTNLPATEVLCRQFSEGISFFRRELNVRPTTAWLADSFGHSRGWPEILAAAGMQGFAFSRPSDADLPLAGPAFWWRSASGAKILCWRVPIGWYGSDRGDMPRRLDAYVEAAGHWGLENVAVFFGLGNHGGGPTRADLRDIARWRAANPGVQVEFSTLHRFFAELRGEADLLPVFDGELNFTMRGCYSTAARFKFAYRRAENALLAAERTTSLLSAAFGNPVPALGEAWAALLLNTFHDVLPGTAIERALDEQQSMLGVVAHQAQCARLDALNALAARLDTRVPAPAEDMPSAVPVLLWNPHPGPFAGCVEIEAALDYRPIRAYRGRSDALPVTVRDHRGEPLDFQLTAVENHF
ncbi:MAG: alpha-mannosidase, partial [Opitutus sp.]